MGGIPGNCVATLKLNASQTIEIPLVQDLTKIEHDQKSEVSRMLKPWSYEQNPSIKNLPDLVHSTMRGKSGDFLIDGSGNSFSFEAFWQLTGQIANLLVSLGVSKGDRVAIQVEKSVKALALFQASTRAGAVILPLNTAYTASELDYFIGDATPAIVVCDGNSFDPISEIAEKHVCKSVLTLNGDETGSLADQAASMSAEFENAVMEWEDLAAILYTSGTTGRSKGAMLTHANLASNALTLAKLWQFTEKDVLLHALPIYHTHGLFVATNTVMLSGGSMIFLPKFDAHQIIENMPRATSLMGVPTFYTRLLKHDGFTSELTKHMRLFVSGSAPLLAETHAEFFDKTGHRILERYGMTETNMNTSNPFDGERKGGTVGLPLEDTDLKITNPETGETLPDGEIGMIEVRGPNVFKGYWNMPEKTAEELREDGFFITGDMGVIDEDGYVSIVGRGKDLIITGGFNVYPKEIEAEIDDIPGVLESAVIGVPHADFGEGVTAIVVPDGVKPMPSAADILAALDGKLAKFKLPKQIIELPELPRNTMGKVQKNVLRDTYKDLYSGT